MMPARRCLPAFATLLLAFLVLSFLPPLALGQATCTAPKNAIEAENCLPGTPASQWYVQADGSPNIQGFATDASVNVGQTIFFKISTSAASYRIDIYRLGFYQGNGARFVTSISPSVSLPQIQPTCLNDSSTGLIDCGNWGISASWTVPGTATSGIYFVRLVRPDTGEVGAIDFVVRNDSSHSDILEQTSDTTWQAYNDYGGNSLYSGNPVGRAYKVSYNRPGNYMNGFFIHEYGMFRFLEANGYDLTYFSGVDTDRNGALITQHRVFMSLGHDEYWSGGQRANVEAARAAGVNLAFFSGDEVSWKTRWEPSIDGTNTPYRTLVCYKERDSGAIDPADPPTWTGRWRDARFSPPSDGGRPQNALTGTLYQVGNPQNNAITVPQADGKMRFWRNTSMATLGSGQVATTPTGTLGYEWDEDADNGFRPAGLIDLSTTTVAVSTYLYFSPSPPPGYYYSGNATATHHITLYRAPSGALVFGAGTVDYGWGVDSNHGTYSGSPPDPNMQQSTVNLLADMGVQPATLQMGLVQATASTDTTPPRSTITSPALGSTVTAGSQVTVLGTAQDFGGGVVGGVEVSVDGGATWHPAVGRENWSYVFTAATSGTLNVLSRAVDDSGNLEVLTPVPTITTQPGNQTVTVGQTATFTAAATGSPTPTVQWQVSTDNGVTFGNVSGATSTTLSFTSASSQNGNEYRAVFMNSAGTAMTRAATLTVNSPTPPTITTQPGNQTVTAGQTATFMAVATGSPTPTVQWQVSTDSGVTFGNVSGATSTTLSFTSASSQNGYQYRAVFTNATGTATTTAATLTVNAAPPASGTVTLQNTNSNLCIDTGGSTSFTYLIQSACSTSNTQKFTLTAAPVSGWYYLVSAASNLCWDVAGGSSSAGALIQQYSCVAVPPEYYQLKAITGGYEILSRNMTNGCLDVVGGSTASGAHIEQNTCTGSANQIFKTASSALSPPTITTQPGNQTVTAGQTATFTAAATGSPTPTVQWQVSTDSGATFGNVSGATSTTLSFAAASSQNTNQYRAIFTNSAGTATTTAAALTVNAAPPPSGAGTAQLITPAAGASGVDPFQAFTWNSVPGAQVYYIYVGTSPGQTDIYNSSEIAPTITSRTVLGLIGGQTYYVTLWTKINNTWNSAPSSFTTASQPLPSDANTFRSTVQQLTGNVRLMTQGSTNSPIPGTLLAQVVAEDGVQWAFCTQYAETLARLFIGQRISTRIRSIVFDGTSSESHVTSEYYDPFLNKWIVADPTFGVVYWNPGIASGLSIDEISSAVAAQNWSYIQPFITYITNNGALYAHNYYMDPILLYLNPLPTGVLAVQLPLANSPQPFFTVHATTDIGTSGTWVFGFVNQTDRVTLSGGSQYGPIGGTIYSQSLTLNIGWSITSGPSGMQILTMNRYLYL
jgi:hypothetical protein